MEGCFTAGSDPELMLTNPKGKLTSAIPLIDGTKEEPKAVKCGAVQRDNVMAEFNVDPADSSEEFEHNTRTVLQELATMVRPNRLTILAYAKFPKKELEHAEARVFGCDPDFSAWPDEDGVILRNSVSAELAMEPYRSAGGHLHIGYKPETREMLENDFGKVAVVKTLDVFLGISAVLLDSDVTAKERRALYGKAGSHRPKPYGVEYRALGNFWIGSPELLHLIYQLADVAVRLTLDGQGEEIIKQAGGQENIIDIINNSRPIKAARVVRGTLSRYLDEATIQRILSKSPSTSIKNTDLYDKWELAA